MYRNSIAAVVLVAIVSPSPVFAWNSLGHKTVAEIAWRQLQPATRQKIVDILRRHPRFDTDFAAKMDDKALNGDKAVEDHWIFQHAATWPDVIRKNKQHDRPMWHYIDLPLFLSPEDRTAFGGRMPVNISTDFPTRTPSEKFNVIEAIGYCQAALRDRKTGPEAKALAYCWLFHLVGDIHQPLHSTALFSVRQFPKGDEGGNQIPLVHGKNLHALWDGLLGTAHYMGNVEKAVAQLSDRETFGDVWDNAALKTDPRQWAEESHTMCENFVYCDEILTAVRQSPDGKLDKIDLPEEYMKDAGERARRRVIAAGVRLGVLLKSLPK